MAKLHELQFELIPHPLYYPVLDPSNYWRFENLKRMLQGKRFNSNEEVIWETEAYIETKKQIVQQKKHRIFIEELLSVNHPRKRLYDE